MIRTTTGRAVVVAALLTSLAYAAAPTVAAQAASQITAAQAAPFLGAWSLAVNGQNGPATFDLTVGLDKDKVVAQIAGPEMPAQQIADLAMAGKTLTLSYAFDYQGMSIDTVVSLTPAADGTLAAQMDFAAGAYVATGTATRKEPAKAK
jgi:hypothetical protein